YQIAFDLALEHGRRQGVYLAEMEDEDGQRFLRISTPIGPMADTDPRRCLQFNWQQRTGFLAISNLDDIPWLHLCENRPYASLDKDELNRVVREVGSLGDRLEQMLTRGVDAT